MKIEWVQPIYLYDTQQNGYSVPVVRVSELRQYLQEKINSETPEEVGFSIYHLVHTLTDASLKEGT